MAELLERCCESSVWNAKTYIHCKDAYMPASICIPFYAT